MRRARSSTAAFVSIAGLAGLSTLVAAASAEERQATVRLEWQASDGCIDTGAVRTQTEDALGRRAFSDGATQADLVLQGVVGRVGQDFRAIVTLSTAAGERLGTRTLTSTEPTCAGLSAGLPLALALMIDLPLREATVRVETKPTSAPLAKAIVAVAPLPSSSPSHEAALEVGPVLRLGGLPVAAFGARAEAVFTAWSLLVGFDATWFAPSLVDDGRVAARVWGVTGGAFACPFHFSGRRGFVSACAVFESGAEVADGARPTSTTEGSSPLRRDAAWLVLLGARVNAGVRIAPPWTVGLSLGGGGFLLRPRIAYDLSGGGSAVLAEAWPAAFDAELSLGVRIP